MFDKGRLPNPPHKGLPTPRAWGQTWDWLDRQPDKAFYLVEAGAGGIFGVASVMATQIPNLGAMVTIPAAGAMAFLGIGLGLAIYGGTKHNMKWW